MDKLRSAAKNRAARLALKIYLEALDAVRADRLMKQTIRVRGGRMKILAFPEPQEADLKLDDFKRIYVVGAGKAATGMAQGLEKRLGKRITEGVVVTKHGHGGPTSRIRILEAGHPIPDQGSLAGGQAVLDMAQKAGKNDLVICLLSGGASALMEAPVEGISLQDIQTVTSLLQRAGADITELNTVRGCLSQIKLGGLARAAYPARLLCLVISDVLGNPLDIIASGPCLKRNPNPAAALDILRNRGLIDAIPASVAQHLNQLAGSKPEKQRSARTDHVIVGQLWNAIEAARGAADAVGLKPWAMTMDMQGEARDIGKIVGSMADEIPYLTGRWLGPDCIILGGETTVTVRGEGLGGRSQELAMVASEYLASSRFKTNNVAILAAGTDGTDGPTDAAGGLVDKLTVKRAGIMKFHVKESLAKSDSYHFLEAAGALLKTGPTHSNVGDLVILVLDDKWDKDEFDD
jgi:hydroxypyruvate reductase